jgi:hypothetical protein
MIRRSLIRLVLVALAVTAALTGQSFYGTVSGTVRDPSGAVLPSGTAVLINEATNDQRTQTTSSAGTFTFALVPPGSYRLEVQATGFKKYVRAVRVEVQQTAMIEASLEVGALTESVDVKAETPLVQSSTSSLGQVIENKQIVDLPLVGRNTLSLIGLTAGAQPIGQFGGIPARTNAYNQGFFSTSGSQVLTNETLIDGVPANAALFNAPAFVPVVDGVEEFKVQTNTLAAEFGRTGGGVVNLVTKSGSNKIRGSAYEFFRNNHLDANNFFSNRSGTPRPLSTTNQFGGTLGGPIVIPKVYDGHDKTFWFFNYEGLREKRGLTQVMTIPTQAQLQGDFSQTFTSAGQLIQIFDPLTTKADPARPGQYLRDPYLGNRIPLSQIDPVAAKVRSFWPAPNTAGVALTAANNYIGNGSAPNTQNQYTGRLDHTIKEQLKIFGRVSWSDVQRGAVDFFQNGGGFVNPGGGGVPLNFNARNAALDATYTLSPTLLLNLRYGFVRQFVFKTPALTGLDLTTIGFPASFNQQTFLRALPAFQPTGYRAIAPASSDLIQRADNTHSMQGNVTKVMARHTFKTGVDFRFIPIGELQPSAPQGSFNFDARFTGQDPLRTTATSGHSIASFLLGYPSSGSIDFNPAVSYSSNYFGLFAQDDFRVTSKLTLNFGLRYEVETGRNERYNRLSWFDPAVTNPVGAQVGLNLRGGLVFAGVDGQPNRQKNTDWNNYGPRIGFAYSMTSKTAIRGGYAVFFIPMTGDDTGRSLGGEGFFAQTSFVSSLDGGITPKDKLSNPFPNGLNAPVGATQGLRTLIGQDIITVLRGDRTAYAQQWNLNVQRELPGNFLIDVSYAGSKSNKLPMDVQLNQLPDQFLSMGSALLEQVPNPFFGIVTVGSLSGRTIARGQLLRPFPQFGSVNTRAVHQGNATYHSAQVKVERRFSKGVSLLGAYTFSKQLTNAGSRLSINFANPGIQNSNNLRAEKAPGNVDVPQRAVFSFNWELPFGRGRAFLNNNTLLNSAFGGWQVNGVAIAQRGVPMGLGTSVNQTNSFGGGSRPNNNGTSAELSGEIRDRLNRYFDTSVFSQPAAFTFGNTARTLPDARAPGAVNVDFSVIKNNRFKERANVQFRAEFFNLLNNVNFGAPGLTFGTTTFGVISSASDARTIQFGLKLLF